MWFRLQFQKFSITVFSGETVFGIEQHTNKQNDRVLLPENSYEN